MQLSCKTPLLLSLATLAALGVAAARPVQAQQNVSFTSGTYSADHLANDGTFSRSAYDTLSLASNNGTVTLTSGVPSLVALNSVTFVAGPSSGGNFGPIHYTGTENLTVDGVSEPLEFAYNVFSGSTTPDVLNILPTTAVFDLGTAGTVKVTTLPFQLQSGTGKVVETIKGNLNANFTLTPRAPSSAAPEPSSVATFAVVGLGLAGLVLRARKRKSAA